MSKAEKFLVKLLRGTSDTNIDFDDLCKLLEKLGMDSEVLAMSEMPKYEVIIYWSNDDQAFIAEVPELSGCMSDGKTYAEAVANVEMIIQEWIETAKELGREIPEPKGRLVFA
jgi:predicted RNase H-like HicB family nuclease